MKPNRIHSPAKTRTTFRFTREDLIAALKAHVEACGERVPHGDMTVWVDEERWHRTNNPATLVIDN